MKNKTDRWFVNFRKFSRTHFACEQGKKQQQRLKTKWSVKYRLQLEEWLIAFHYYLSSSDSFVRNGRIRRYASGIQCAVRRAAAAAAADDTNSHVYLNLKVSWGNNSPFCPFFCLRFLCSTLFYCLLACFACWLASKFFGMMKLLWAITNGETNKWTALRFGQDRWAHRLWSCWTWIHTHTYTRRTWCMCVRHAIDMYVRVYTRQHLTIQLRCIGFGIGRDTC